MSGALLVRTEGPVRILVNSNPAARNAITPELYDAGASDFVSLRRRAG